MATNTASLIRITWTGVTRAAATVGRAWQRRRVVGRLASLDDRLLADMGITRYDVQSVLAEPMFTDPTEKLAERAREARLARRASAVERMAGEPSPTLPSRRAA